MNAPTSGKQSADDPYEQHNGERRHLLGNRAGDQKDAGADHGAGDDGDTVAHSDFARQALRVVDRSIHPHPEWWGLYVSLFSELSESLPPVQEWCIPSLRRPRAT